MSAVDPRLLDALVAVADGLELGPTLRRIVEAARDLTGARYAALGVLGKDQLHSAFIYTGMDGETAEAIGHPPHGLGVLGHITRAGHTLRTTQLSRHPSSRGFPAEHPPMNSFLGVPVGIGEHVVGNLYLTEKDGGFTAQDEELVVALAAAAAVAVENARLYADVQARARWIAAAQEVSTAMLSGADEGEALQLIAERAAHVADADGAALVLPGIGQDWVLEIAVGEPALARLIGTVMPADGRAISVLRTGIGLRVAELSRESGLQVPGFRSFGPALYAPLMAREEPVGVLILVRLAGGREFSPADLATAQTFAGQAAISMRLAEGRRREEQADLLEERARIARDLHDLVVQELFAMGMRLNGLRDAVSPDVLAGVDSSLDSLDRVVRQIRSTIAALRDPDRTTSLTDLVHAEAVRAQSFLGFAPSVTIEVEAGLDPEHAVPDEVLDDLVAVIREGLSNAARHGRAAAVAVHVVVDARQVRAEVVDDGCGVPTDVERRSGLDNLGERARRHGGTFTMTTPASPLESAPVTTPEALAGSDPQRPGTLLTWTVPLRTDSPEASAGTGAVGE